MIIVDKPVGFMDPDEAERWARCIEVAINVTEATDRVRLPADHPLRNDLVKLRRLAALRSQPVATGSSGPGRSMRSVKEVARQQGISTSAVTAKCRRGSLAAVKGDDGQWRIFADELDLEETR